jgi:hypothetical protein
MNWIILGAAALALGAAILYDRHRNKKSKKKCCGGKCKTKKPQ